ncbi:protein sel-1 homolog 3-like isoform X2 [Pseudorasbora parva]|uniref:protein sel-1 homolog 3-like isoform X2 n=1 Tax=Pseudorasbora parva TaxID=51549 RepID=UPI00351F4D32
MLRLTASTHRASSLKMRDVLSFICTALLLTPVWSESPDTDRTLQGDFVQFGEAPDRVMDKCSVQVQYNCSAACRIGVEIIISTPTRTGVIVYRRTWTNHKSFGKPRSRKVPLAFPPAVLYRRDFFVRRPLEACDVVLRAWLLHLDKREPGGSHAGGYDQSLVRTSLFLRTLPTSQRPAYPQTRSVSWGAWLIWQLTKDTVRKCSQESDTVDILTFPFASTGERFGVIHTFLPFKNRDLERRRTLALKQPSVTLSLWLYLLSWCSQSVCGIVKHVNEHRKYGSPLIMLSDAGNIVLQVQTVAGEVQAFTAHTALPLHTWIRLDIFFQVSKAKLTITKVLPAGQTLENTHFFDFRQPVKFIDTSGYFVFGGDNYMNGFHGYFGPIRYHRLGSEKVNNPLSPVRTLKELDRFHRHCEEMQQVTEHYLEALRKNRDISRDVCDSYYGDLMRTFGRKECTQTWSWGQQRRFNMTLRLLEDHQDFITGLESSGRHLLHLSRVIFQDVVKTISKAEESDGSLDLISTLIEKLQVSYCWGHHRSSLLLATLHLAGLGVPVDLEQQTPTEHIHLNNDEELHTQTGEQGDIVQYLKHQANRGDVESQKSLARMLLWGSNGVEKDIQTAVMWYARSALQMVDPTAMYDYAILLLKGTGVKKNRTLGLELLEKAADMGSVEALNGLGWYYSSIVKNGTKAFRYFELAAQNGSRDGLFNVGVFQLNGASPDKPDRNETAAFHYFWRAAQLGHVDGAVESASFLSTGTVRGVARDQGKAVLLLKQVSETNGHLGFMVKEALQTYQRGSWDEALVKYAMLAETGLGVAQHNAAHLCEVLGHSSACQWRYLNYSTYNHIPQEAGLLRMGDYYSKRTDMVKAIYMYSTAAVHGSPQGLFNLAMLIEEGYEVPNIILDQMGISAAHDVNRSVVVEYLLSRCREFEEGDVTPCSLVLLRIQLIRAWRDFTHSSVQLLLACGLAAIFSIFVIAVLSQTLLEFFSTAYLSTNQSSERHDEPAVGGQEIRDSSLETSTHQHRPTAAHSSLSLRETSDLVVTVTGVCVCVIFTMLIYHLL